MSVTCNCITETSAISVARDADACSVLQARVSAGTKPELVVLMDIPMVKTGMSAVCSCIRTLLQYL